jgi:hypothetical protein
MREVGNRIFEDTRRAMNESAARDLIGDKSVSGDIGDDTKTFLFELIDILDAEYFDAKRFCRREFEGSFVEDIPKIRLLHLEFPHKVADGDIPVDIRKRREETMIDILRKTGEYFRCRYAVDFCKKFLSFNAENGAFPLQIGLEHEESGKPKVKAYLSVNSGDFPVEKFFLLAGIDAADTMRFLRGKRFDTVAVDFLSDGKTSIKFYPLSSGNAGLLARLDDDGSIVSRKAWVRFPRGLDIGNISESGFFDVPLSLRDHMERCGMRVSYMCLENGRESIYFR